MTKISLKYIGVIIEMNKLNLLLVFGHDLLVMHLKVVTKFVIPSTGMTSYIVLLASFLLHFDK